MRKSLILALLLVIPSIAFSAEIDVGSPAVDLGGSAGGGSNWVAQNNTANDTGTIDHVEFYAASSGGVALQVASFYVVSSSNLSTRADISLSVATGSGFQGFDAPSDFTAFDINSGDMIGAYVPSNSAMLDVNNTSGAGVYVTFGSDRVPCTNFAFMDWGNMDVALYGTGETAGGGPSSTYSSRGIGRGIMRGVFR